VLFSKHSSLHKVEIVVEVEMCKRLQNLKWLEKIIDMKSLWDELSLCTAKCRWNEINCLQIKLILCSIPMSFDSFLWIISMTWLVQVVWLIVLRFDFVLLFILLTKPCFWIWPKADVLGQTENVKIHGNRDVFFVIWII